MMPEVNGLEVLEAVAADEALSQRHAIIVVTGAIGPASEGRIKGLRDQLGIPLIGKPFTVEHLLDTIEATESRWALVHGTTTERAGHEGRDTHDNSTLQASSYDNGSRDGENEATPSGSDTSLREDDERNTPDIQKTLREWYGQTRQGNDDVPDVNDLLDRVHVLMCQCQYEEALALAQCAAELAPENVKAWYELGSNYGYLGRVADLEQAFEQALHRAVTPEEEATVWFSRGHAENNADAWEASLRSFQRLAELEPTWGGPHLMQALVLGNMGAFIDRRYYEEALIAVDRALIFGGLRPADESMAYSLRASSLVNLGRDAEAKYYQRRAKEMWQAEQAASP